MQAKVIHPYSPTVIVVDDFFPKEKCKAIIEKALEKDIFKQSKVGDDPKTSTKDYRRTSKGGFLNYEDCIEAYEFLLQAANFLKVRPEQAEKAQLVKYDLGEEYAPHHDAFDITSKQLEEGGPGQRIATALLYLNTPIEGGETSFPNLLINPNQPGYEVQATTGRCVFFTTTFLGKQDPHPKALHGAIPITKGEKYVCNYWFRENQMYRFKTPEDK